VQVAAFLLGILWEIKRETGSGHMKIPQGLVVVLFVGGVIVFFLSVIFSSRKKKDKDSDKKNSS
jgi:hypothetical protein